MKIEIRYYTKSGNTKKLADAIAEVTGSAAKDISVPLAEKTDLLFLCNSVYWAGADGKVKQFIKDNADRIGTLVNVSTAAMIESTYGQISNLCQKYGVNISEKEFHCKGKFAAFHKGHPDENDISAVRAFAKKITGDIK